jgi:glycosyltransferase involved in cell wall biosynthesis
MMKILIIVENNPFFVSSAESNRLISLILGLKKFDVSIHLIITNGFQNINEYNNLGFKGQNSIYSYQYTAFLFNSNIWLRRLNKFVIKPFIKSVFQIFTVNNILKYDPDIIWVSMDLSSLKIILEKKLKVKGFKFFIEISEFLDIHNIQNTRFIHRLSGNNRQKLFNEFVIPELNGLVVMTSALFSEFKGYGNLKLLHLPMTVDLNRFKDLDLKLGGLENPYIAFVGVMDNMKDGVNILIHAFNIIQHKFPNVKLYLIGGWNYDTPLHLEIIKKLNLENRVKWLGEFSREKIPIILQNATLLVLPRPDSKQARGGFPTKLGEYLATGNPVCATSVGEIPDYLIDNESVFFAQPGSIESFADAMDRALSNYENAKRVGLNGKKVAEKEFHKDIQAKKLYDFLKELVEERQ